MRQRNNERRDTYYSTADTGATWLQASTLPEEVCTGPGKGKGKNQQCTTTTTIVATLGTYAAHPTIVNDDLLNLHADWPGAAARRFEALYGGVGLMFEGGLGNVSVSGAGGATDEEEAENTGIAIADDISADFESNARRLATNVMAQDTREITHPLATNPGLVTLADVGLFDREFQPGTPGAGPPDTYHWSREKEPVTIDGEEPVTIDGEDSRVNAESHSTFFAGCDTAGPTVITVAGAHRVGDLLIAFGPGEIFSNISEVIKERADNNSVAMVFGQANDALGYIIQSFEYDYAANVPTHYGVGSGEYEEVFAIDHCFGDHVLETILESTGSLGFGG